MQAPIEYVEGIDIVPLAQEVYPRVQKRIEQIYSTAQFSQGALVAELEAACQEHFAANRAVGCGNGTVALHLACLAKGVGPGDNVVVPANSFIATALGPLYCGAEVRLADICPETLNLDAGSVASLVDLRTKLVIGVDFGGNPLDVQPFQAKGVEVLLDGAHSHGGVTVTL
jgi:dTDP-4-amino-4,6-dideoxygalactose transaminase